MNIFLSVVPKFQQSVVSQRVLYPDNNSISYSRIRHTAILNTLMFGARCKIHYETYSRSTTNAVSMGKTYHSHRHESFPIGGTLLGSLWNVLDMRSFPPLTNQKWVTDTYSTIVSTVKCIVQEAGVTVALLQRFYYHQLQVSNRIKYCRFFFFWLATVAVPYLGPV